MLEETESVWQKKASFRSLTLRERPQKTGTRESKAAQDGSAEGPASAFPFNVTASLPLMR